MYILPDSNNYCDLNAGSPYWVYVGYWASGDSNGNDLVLDFMAHSYTNGSWYGQDSITTLRLKAGSSPPTGRSFYGNGQAYYIGALAQPTSFIIQRFSS